VVEQTDIFLPFLGLMLLTLVVWVYMYVRRLGHIRQQRIDPQALTTPDRAAALIPESAAYPAYNFSNLLELPILFYALCLYLFVTSQVDALYLGLAWLFVVLRVLHSAIHCTVNVVSWRFASYVASALMLWWMLARALLAALGD